MGAAAVKKSPAKKKVAPRRALVDLASIKRMVAEHLKIEAMVAQARKASDEYKGQVMSALEKSGSPLGEGHRVFEFSEPIEDPAKPDSPVTGVKRERRAGKSLNAERAMALIEARGWEKDCIVMEPVLNEDALLALNFSNDLSDEDLASLYDERETFAFIKLR